MEITFQTKTILITGAAGQLGHVVAQGYSASGAQRLLLLDKPEQRAALEAQAQELEEHYPTCAVHVSKRRRKPSARTALGWMCW